MHTANGRTPMAPVIVPIIDFDDFPMGTPSTPISPPKNEGDSCSAATETSTCLSSAVHSTEKPSVSGASVAPVLGTLARK